MGAIFGLAGQGDLAAVREMGARMPHRGSLLRAWSPAPDVYFGERSASDGPHDSQDPLALDESIYRLDAAPAPPLERDLAPREGLRRLLKARNLAELRGVRGTFAAAWWSSEACELWLTVDHLGYKSLYFCCLDGRVAFASEYKAFFALPDFRPEIDPVAVQYHQACRIAMAWRPSLANVEMVHSGSVTRIRAGQATREAYWVPRVSESGRTIDESGRLVREQMSRTIADQTRSHDRVGISLSGGIDSAIVAGCTCEVKAPDRVAAYSVGYAEEDPELIGAGQVARYLGIEHRLTLFEHGDIRKLLPEAVWLMEDCTAREEVLLHLKMFQDVAGRETLVLHGVGADLLFGGMPRHQVLALSMRLPLLRRPLIEFFQFTQSGKEPQGIPGKALAWTAYRGSSFAPPRVAGAAEATAVAEPSDLNRYLADSAANMSSVHYTEPMAEQNGFAFRAPYLDPDALDLSLSIPMRHKIGWRKQKLVLRNAFAGLLPDHVTKRPKTIHRLRHDVILSDALDDMAKDCGNLENVRERSLVDAGYLGSLQHREAGKPYSTDRLYRLWTLVSLEIWLRQFVDGGGQYWTFIA